MSDIERFHTGLSVEQAKKDAKKLAKDKSIPLHVAQDIIAHEKIGMSWSKAMFLRCKKSHDNSSDLATFVLSRDKGNVVTCSLTKDTPVAYIAGRSGCGKSVVATELAIQHLISGKPVTYFPGYDIPLEPLEPSMDLAHYNILTLKKTYPELFQVIPGRGEEVLGKLKATNGSLVVLDEAWMLLGKQPASPVLSRILAQGAGIVIIGQALSDFPGDLSIDKVAFVLLGHNCAGHAPVFGDDVINILETLNDSLGIDQSRARFLLAKDDLSVVVDFTI
ncbi:MAG: AAA family ATPase [Candidatus Thiodiazotropha endolucinida]|nr:AAA family ATPase [Candidatus Thiodiazotropha taylori]MCW4268078.1 AAA family ATPase [Candidatus Thiodiazotropha endolucinida]